MTKNATKLWLGGLRSVLAIQKQTARAANRAAKTIDPDVWRVAAQTARTVAKAAEEAQRAATMPAPVASPPRESRVRPRAAAWAAGAWLRSTFAAPRPDSATTRSLTYGLYIPAGHEGERLPLVVMLHGCTQTIDSFADGSRMNLLADQHGFAVLYPEQSIEGHVHQCWHWYDAREQAGGGEAAAIVALIDSVIDEYGFDGSRVYLAGMSAGAGLAALLAVTAPRRFAAVALHSGPAFGEAHSGITAMDVMRRGVHGDPAALIERWVEIEHYPGMPALIVQGSQDRVVAPVNAEQLALQFLHLNRLAGADAIEEEAADHLIRDYRRGDETLVRTCDVTKLDHAWSGGDDTIAFNSSTGPAASEMIWSFFEGRTRSDATGVYNATQPADA